MGKPFVQNRNAKKSNLMLHCQQCFNPIIERIKKNGKPIINGCMKWDLPKEPRGRKTIKQRTLYYGWHLVAKPNMKMNNIPIEQISFFKKLFFGKIVVNKTQSKKFVEMILKQLEKSQRTEKRARRIAKMRVGRMIIDTKIIRKQIMEEKYTLETRQLFEQSAENFEKNLRKLKENL